MAHVLVPVVKLQDSVADATAPVAAAANDTFEITGLDGRMGKTVVLLTGNGATVTFDPGTLPPSQRQGMGDLAVVINSTAVRRLVLEGQRYLDSSAPAATLPNTITGTVTAAAATISAVQIGNSV